MRGESELASQVIFGWDPLWVSSILFIATYALIVSEKVNRAIAAKVGLRRTPAIGLRQVLPADKYRRACETWV